MTCTYFSRVRNCWGNPVTPLGTDIRGKAKEVATAARLRGANRRRTADRARLAAGGIALPEYPLIRELFRLTFMSGLSYFVVSTGRIFNKEDTTQMFQGNSGVLEHLCSVFLYHEILTVNIV